MPKQEASKALAFKKKYQHIEQCAPEDVGKACIASLVYVRLKAKDEQLPDFISIEQRDELVSKLTTPEIWQRYTAYRQLEEWIKSRNLENVVELAALRANVTLVKERLCNMAWAEEAERGIELKDADNEAIFPLCKIDTAMFAFSDWKEESSITGRSDILFTMNQINRYNALIGLIAEEIKIPELADVCTIDLTPIKESLERINNLIAELKTEIFERYEDDGDIGTIKRHAFDIHIAPYSTEPEEIPKKRLDAASVVLKGLKIFNDPLGGTTLDKIIKGMA